MEKTLNGRFTKIAKSFGKGITNVLKGGGIAGIALSLVNKLLNPLKEVQEAIEKSLAASDDIVTNAKQFGTTPANLARLTAFAGASGLGTDNLNLLLTKFQATVAEAIADPTKNTSVRQFTGDKDTARAFFEFIQSLQKMDKNQQILVQQEVFGEKQILKMSDFLNTDFSEFSKRIAKFSNEKLDRSLNKQGSLNDFKDEIAAARDLGDIITKGRLINKGTVTSIEAGKARDLQLENDRIANFENIKSMDNSIKEISLKLEKLVIELSKGLPVIIEAVNSLLKVNQSVAKFLGDIYLSIKNSRVMKSIFGSKEGK